MTSASTAGSSQVGRIDSWSSVPSETTGSPFSGATMTWKGTVLGEPRRNVSFGATSMRVKVAVPGSVTIAAGSALNFRTWSGSLNRMSALTRWFPRLSTASSNVALRLPRLVRGNSSAVVSSKPPTAIVPSSTMEPSMSSLETTRTPNGTSPAAIFDDFGGLNTTRAVPSAPGNRLSTAGSTTAHGPASPMTSSENWSTTVPLFRTLISQLASPPGSTVSSPCDNDALGSHGRATYDRPDRRDRSMGYDGRHQDLPHGAEGVVRTDTGHRPLTGPTAPPGTQRGTRHRSL